MEIIFKDIKKLVQIIGFFLLGVILLLAVAVIAFKNNTVQNYIAHQVTQQLSQKLKTRVSISRVDYKYFNSFSFENLYIQDQQKDTLLFVESGKADFDFWKFFSGKFIFKEINLNRLYGNLVIDTAGVSNLDFVIKAFQRPKKPKKVSNVEFNFKTINISNSNFRLTNLKNPAIADSTRFDANRMNFRQLNLVLNVDYFKKDSISARIRSFSMVEQSGLIIQNMETSVNGWRKGFSLPFVNISLPNSTLAMDSVTMTYDSIASLKEIEFCSDRNTKPHWPKF